MRIVMVCRNCKSEDVCRDATAKWSKTLQTWKLAGVQDQGYCSTCGETVIEERTQLAEDYGALVLSADDWTEIYYALVSKLESPTVAGDDAEAVAWRKHLSVIIDTIGPDAVKAIIRGVAPIPD